ncbi:hypothetical protein SKAU_G00373880 [Synaphobranchus kaupii]|uniref:Uncharacterized protein n=1 Tax=Synaphobranchus kaupii TaxID=118154 RepID=A0A9Q1EGQ6_SYNKA|nr:hypothetical protein SKAU_G00373880 [Synaphobranchus kaupii]
MDDTLSSEEINSDLRLKPPWSGTRPYWSWGRTDGRTDPRDCAPQEAIINLIAGGQVVLLSLQARWNQPKRSVLSANVGQPKDSRVPSLWPAPQRAVFGLLHKVAPGGALPDDWTLCSPPPPPPIDRGNGARTGSESQWAVAGPIRQSEGRFRSPLGTSVPVPLPYRPPGRGEAVGENRNTVTREGQFNDRA